MTPAPLVASSHFGVTDWVLIVVVVVLLAASGLLALAETSLVRTSRVKVRPFSTSVAGALARWSGSSSTPSAF